MPPNSYTNKVRICYAYSKHQRLFCVDEKFGASGQFAGGLTLFLNFDKLTFTIMAYTVERLQDQ